MRECPACGEELDDGVDVCWKCGAADDGGDDAVGAGCCQSCGAELPESTLGSLEDPRPLCEDCRLVVELASEEERSCPVDEVSMEKEEYRGVAIDRCPLCGGVWLDEGKLERIERAVDSAE